MKMIFGYFHIQIIIPQTVLAEKVYKRNGVTCLFVCDFLELWSLSYQKLCYFCNFMLISARNPGLL